jgi:uncharacterized protein (TIGR00251 family)
MSLKPEAAEVSVRVIPRSSKNKVIAEPDGSLKVWVTAPPVDGEANAAVIEVLSKSLGLKRAAVSILSGECSRNKRLRVEGLSLETLLETLRNE